MDRPPPPPPPHERAAAHGSGTLYTPESLRQWRLARQQKKQQQNQQQHQPGRGAQAVHDSDGGTGDVAVAAAPASLSLDASRGRPDATDPREAPSLPLRTPSQRSGARSAPYTRVSPLALKLHERRAEACAPRATTPSSSEIACHETQQPTPVATVGASPTQSAYGGYQELVPHVPVPALPAAAVVPASIRGGEGSERDRRAAETTTGETTRARHQAATCRVGWCTQPPKRLGLCWTHGGEKKCCRADCGRAASQGEFCDAHAAQLRR